jgi:hypothetical protein
MFRTRIFVPIKQLRNQAKVTPKSKNITGEVGPEAPTYAKNRFLWQVGKLSYISDCFDGHLSGEKMKCKLKVEFMIIERGSFHCEINEKWA